MSDTFTAATDAQKRPGGRWATAGAGARERSGARSPWGASARPRDGVRW